VVEEFGYFTGAIPAAPDPIDAFSDNGLVELAALDNEGTLLALERSFAVGVGNTIRLYEVLTQEATDLSSIDDLFDEDTGVPVDYSPVEKRLLVDFADLGLTPDNVEGMTLGPRLSDGRQALVLVSDNNFNPDQVTQFIVLALDLETSS
jgi:3-phytase/alkaline phosphatase D